MWLGKQSRTHSPRAPVLSSQGPLWLLPEALGYNLLSGALQPHSIRVPDFLGIHFQHPSSPVGNRLGMGGRREDLFGIVGGRVDKETTLSFF